MSKTVVSVLLATLCVAVAQAQGMGRTSMPGLPSFAPSSMPTRFYDSTEYDVSPLQLPLNLPGTPPPEPALVQTAATVNARSASAEHVLGRMDSIAAAALAESRANAEAAQVVQRQAMAARLMMRQQQMAAAAKQRAAAMQQQQMMQQRMAMAHAQRMGQAAPVSLLQQSASVHHTQKSHAKAKSKSKAHARHRSKHHARHTVRHSNRAEAAQHAWVAQQQQQKSFLDWAQRMRFVRRPMPREYDPVASPFTVPNAFVQQQQMTTAQVMPPRYAAPVRQYPSALPAQPYAAFFEAAAIRQPMQPMQPMQQQQQQMFGGRPQEPTLPRLPPPPIAVSEI